MIKKFIDSIKYLKIKDFLAIFIFIILLIPAMIFKLMNKLKKKEIWLVCEHKDTARDNGYHFFKYMREEHPDENVYYAINTKSTDYKKIEKYGNIIEFGSIKHWIYYLAANKNISSQKSGNPSAPLFYVLHVYLNLFNNRVFLQHGIIKDDLDFLHYKNTKYKKFICGAKKEFDYVNNKKIYGYPKGNVIYTGLARFDNLHNNKINNKQILIMPTWRSWLGRKTNALNQDGDFCETDFYKSWNSLLNDKKFNNFINEENITVYFYPHYNMNRYLKYFNLKNKNIKVVDNSMIDIQTLLKESALMITDYSSVYMDFAYMKKPLIYYQFDKEEYRKRQYVEGYFNYERDGFGEVIKDSKNVVNKIIKYVKNNYKVESKYQKRMDEFYPLHDQNNCKRIYEEIKK